MWSIGRAFGTWFIAIALIVVPFSMSHAEMVNELTTTESSAMTDDHDMMSVDKHRHSQKHQHSQTDDFGHSHDSHDNPNCCSSICGGALAMDHQSVDCFGMSKLIHVYGQNALEPGELVPPFRPPSI